MKKITLLSAVIVAIAGGIVLWQTAIAPADDGNEQVRPTNANQTQLPANNEQNQIAGITTVTDQNTTQLAAQQLQIAPATSDNVTADKSATKFNAENLGSLITEQMDNFYHHKNLSMEQLVSFFTQLEAFLATSEPAREQLWQYLRQLPANDTNRQAMIYFLSRGDYGKNILEQEAMHILQTGQADNYHEMFQILYNSQTQASQQATEKAIEVLNTGEYPHGEIGAINYLRKLIHNPELLVVMQDSVKDSLFYTLDNNTDAAVRSNALQTIVHILTPVENADIVTDILQQKVDSHMLVKIFSGINNDHIPLTEDISELLKQQLNRTNLSQNTLAWAKTAVPHLVEEQPANQANIND